MWHSVTVYGTLTVCDIVWQYATICDSVWQHVTLCDSIWHFVWQMWHVLSASVVKYNNCCHSVTLCENVWQSGTLFDSVWQYVTPCAIVWQYVTMCDTIWQYMTTCDTMFHGVTICDSVWQRVTVWDTIWQCVTPCAIVWQCVTLWQMWHLQEDPQPAPVGQMWQLLPVSSPQLSWSSVAPHAEENQAARLVCFTYLLSVTSTHTACLTCDRDSKSFDTVVSVFGHVGLDMLDEKMIMTGSNVV